MLFLYWTLVYTAFQVLIFLRRVGSYIRTAHKGERSNRRWKKNLLQNTVAICNTHLSNTVGVGAVVLDKKKKTKISCSKVPAFTPLPYVDKGGPGNWRKPGLILNRRAKPKLNLGWLQTAEPVSRPSITSGWTRGTQRMGRRSRTSLHLHLIPSNIRGKKREERCSWAAVSDSK